MADCIVVNWPAVIAVTLLTAPRMARDAVETYVRANGHKK